MKPFSYKNITEELIKNTGTPKKTVFDYFETPHESECEEVFQFYQENLTLNSKYGISPSIFYFKYDENINAFAWTDKGYFIVCMFIGTIVLMKERFKDNPQLLPDNKLTEFTEFGDSLDTSINNLMYQNIIHYTFYHELGHLIQKSKLLENRLYENTDTTSAFSIYNHILEMDADEFSAISMGIHILDYSERMFGDDITQEQFEKLIVIACSSIFLFILSFPSNRGSIYYEQGSHPHPIIRIVSVVFTMISYCNEAFKAKEKKFNLNGTDLVNRITGFSSIIENELIENRFLKSPIVSNYTNTIQNEGMNVFNYVKKLKIIRHQDEHLAVFIYNKMIAAGL